MESDDVDAYVREVLVPHMPGEAVLKPSARLTSAALAATLVAGLLVAPAAVAGAEETTPEPTLIPTEESTQAPQPSEQSSTSASTEVPSSEPSQPAPESTPTTVDETPSGDPGQPSQSPSTEVTPEDQPAPTESADGAAESTAPDQPASSPQQTAPTPVIADAPVAAAVQSPQRKSTSVTLTKSAKYPRHLVANVNPNSASVAFVVQLFRKTSSGEWARVRAVRSTGAAEIAVFRDVPRGTYKAKVVRQSVYKGAWSAPYAHTPPLKRSSVTLKAGTNGGLVANVNPNLANKAFRVVVYKKVSGQSWKRVTTKLTSGRYEVATFPRAGAGTYKVRVQQANGYLASASGTAVVSDVSRYKRQRVVNTALGQIGDQYVMGGEGPHIFDCSGLMLYAYKHGANVSLPHNTYAQRAVTKYTSRPQAGDLAFFFRGADHVGMYIGNGKMVHAANPRSDVAVVELRQAWYQAAFSSYGSVL